MSLFSQFGSGVAVKQSIRGIATIAYVSGANTVNLDVTIPAVNTAKAAVNQLGWSLASAGNGIVTDKVPLGISVQLLNSTTVRITLTVSQQVAASYNVSYEVIEFK